MKVSQKADYAFRAMLELSLHGATSAPVRSAEIADRSGVPDKFLEAILVDLRNAGLVRSVRGPEGGHRLARPPSAITAAQIRQAIDGPLSIAPEGGARSRSRQPVDGCMRELWGKVEQAARGVLEGVTLEDLRRRADAQRAVPDFSI